MVVLGGGGGSYERGTPVGFKRRIRTMGGIQGLDQNYACNSTSVKFLWVSGLG